MAYLVLCQPNANYISVDLGDDGVSEYQKQTNKETIVATIEHLKYYLTKRMPENYFAFCTSQIILDSRQNQSTFLLEKPSNTRIHQEDTVMDIPLCFSPIEANYNVNVLENEFSAPETQPLGNQKKKPVNETTRQNRMSLPAINTDSDVNSEVRKTIVEWRGTRARRHTEEEKRQTWRRSLNSPIQKFFWTDIVSEEQNKERNMSVDSIIEENAVCDDVESDECIFISRDEDGNPVFSPALCAARQVENEDAVKENCVNPKEQTMDDFESKKGNETPDSENRTEQRKLVERIHALSVQEV